MSKKIRFLLTFVPVIETKAWRTNHQYRFEADSIDEGQRHAREYLKKLRSGEGFGDTVKNPRLYKRIPFGS